MDFSLNSTTPLGLHSASALVEEQASQLAFGRPVQAHNKADKQLPPTPACSPVAEREKTEELSGIACRTGDRQGAERLLRACHTGDCEAVRAQLHENRDLARKAVITEQSERGYTALDVAARGGYVEIVRLLLESGADVNSRSGTRDRTPLMQVGLHASGKEPELPADLAQVLALPEQPSAAQSEHSGQAVSACSRDHLHCLRLLINSGCLLYTSPSPRDRQKSRMPSSA